MKYLSTHLCPVLFILLLMAGCIHEDRSGCLPVQLSFIHTTPCGNGVAYPADIDSLHIYVFDKKGIFVKDYIFSNIQLSQKYTCEILVPSGPNTLVAWLGKGNLSQTNPTNFVPGSTTLSEASLSLHKGYCPSTATTDSVLVCKGALYFGSTQAEPGTAHQVQLTKNTTGIHVSASGLQPQGTYRLTITGDDDYFNFDNTFTSPGKLNYIQPLLCDTKGCAQAGAHIINPEWGTHPLLIVTDEATGHELLRSDLVELITERMPEVNFECIHEFDIDIEFSKDLSFSVNINGWGMNDEEDDL